MIIPNIPRQFSPLPTFLSASVLLGSSPALAGTMAPTPPTPPVVEAASAGLLNDALRQASPAFAAWDIGGQLRVRYEMKKNAGAFPENDFIRESVKNDNDAFLFREKLHAGWQATPWLKFFVEGRGSQAAGDARNPSPDQDVWDLQQAYVQVGDASQFPLTLKVGRQEWVEGDQRLVSNSDWSNTCRSFDAISLRYAPSHKTYVDVFTGRLVISRDGYFNESNDYDQFSGIYGSSEEVWPGVETQAFFFARNVGSNSPNAIAPGVGGPSERDVYTYGVRLKSLPSLFHGWDFLFEGLGQFGQVVSNGVERDLNSYAFNGAAGYTFLETWGKPRLGVGYDYGSGDSNPKDHQQGTFEPLLGTSHSYYGLADLIGLRNISSPRFSASIKPTKKLSLSTEYLLYWLADTADSLYPETGPARSQNGYGKNPSYPSYVGSELDILAKVALTSSLELQIGYGHFFAGDYLKSTLSQGTNHYHATGADWFYLQTTFNF